MKLWPLLLLSALLLSACPAEEELQSTSLIHAVEMGDMRGVRHYDDGSNINTPDEHGRTPMSIALLRGDQAVVQLLFEKGAVLPDDKPCYAMYQLVEWQDSEMLKVLLTNGLDANHVYLRPDDKETSLLVHSATNNLSGLINILVVEGADIEKECEGMNPIEAASANNAERAVRELLKLGAKPTDRAKELARYYRHPSVLKLLEEAS